MSPVTVLTISALVGVAAISVLIVVVCARLEAQEQYRADDIDQWEDEWEDETDAGYLPVERLSDKTLLDLMYGPDPSEEEKQNERTDQPV